MGWIRFFWHIMFILSCKIFIQNWSDKIFQVFSLMYRYIVYPINTRQSRQRCITDIWFISKAQTTECCCYDDCPLPCLITEHVRLATPDFPSTLFALFATCSLGRFDFSSKIFAYCTIIRLNISKSKRFFCIFVHKNIVIC